MLGLPLTSVLLATLLLTGEGAQVMPLVIVAVVVAMWSAARLTPAGSPPSDDARPEDAGSMSQTTTPREKAKV